MEASCTEPTEWGQVRRPLWGQWGWPRSPVCADPGCAARPPRRASATDGPHRRDLLFARADGRPFQSTSASKRASKHWEKAGLEGIGLHEARHTFALLMIAAGVNATALSSYMGHANISITIDRYGHLMPGNEAEVAGLLDAYLGRANTAARLAALGEG